MFNNDLLARQASAGRLMLCRCYFLSSSFFNDRLKQRDVGNYKTDLHQISRDGRHVGVHVQSGIDFPIGEETMPWQPTNFRREIGRNRRHAFLLGIRIRQRMAGTAERICAKFI